jgi:hypothetical protein
MFVKIISFGVITHIYITNIIFLNLSHLILKCLFMINNEIIHLIISDGKFITNYFLTLEYKRHGLVGVCQQDTWS